MSRPKGHRDADYEVKRRELLRRMSARLMRREGGALSLRELSAAAGVAIPTLRHYFGARHNVVDAIFEEALRLGRRGLEAQSVCDKPFAQSVRDYVEDLIAALHRPREVRLSDLFAVSIAEGLLDAKISPSTLNHIIDPTVDVLVARLQRHQERGEMRPGDARAAAFMLISPILLTTLHQDQLGGAVVRPLDMPALAEELTESFVRAYAAAPVAASTPERAFL